MKLPLCSIHKLPTLVAMRPDEWDDLQAEPGGTVGIICPWKILDAPKEFCVMSLDRRCFHARLLEAFVGPLKRRQPWSTILTAEVVAVFSGEVDVERAA